MNITPISIETLVHDQDVIKTYVVHATHDEIESLYEDLRDGEDEDATEAYSDIPLYRRVLYPYFTRGCNCSHDPCGHWQSRATEINRTRRDTYNVTVRHYRNT